MKSENELNSQGKCILVGVFTICYFGWVTVHIQREFWAISKKQISQEDPTVTATYYGAIDFCFFMTYGVS